MSIEEIALRLIESDCGTDYYFKILDELGNNTTKIQELEKEKLHIEIAYEEDYKEQQQEIERLNNELQFQIEDNTRLNEYIEEKDKEIERLNGALQTHEILLKSNVLEIERLNNIINELEKFVKNCNEYNSKCNSTIYEARAFEDSVILYKIKELKGSDKE